MVASERGEGIKIGGRARLERVESSRPALAASGDRLDKTGAFASLLCAVHCALMPLLVTLLPLIGLGFLASEPVEWALVATSAVLGVSSLRLGFREHGKRRALATLAVGLTLLTLGRVSESHEWGAWGVPVLVLGGCTVAFSHVFNGRLCRACRACACSSVECNLP